MSTVPALITRLKGKKNKNGQCDHVSRQPDGLARPASVYATQPLVSLLVAAWNEEAQLVAFLTSFMALAYPQKELILCAGGDDQTWALAQAWATPTVTHPTVTVLQQHRGEGKLCALQRCLRQARGAIIVLTDADCILHSEGFQQLIDPLLHNQASVTTGKVCPLRQQRVIPFVLCQWAQMEWALIDARSRSAHSTFLVGQHSALRRTIVEAAYAASPAIDVGEDTYLAFYARRAGHAIRQIPAGYVETEFPERFLAYVRQRSRWRRYELLQAYQFGEQRILWQGVASLAKHLLWVALPLLPLLGAYNRPGWVGLLVGAAIWWTIWLATFVRFRRQHHLGKQALQAFADLDDNGPSAWVLWQLLFANSCAVIYLAISVALPAWRYRW